MEQLLDAQTPEEKIYREKAILIGTFLGGPLAAGYMIAENFKAFNEFENAKRTRFFTILSTVLIVSGLFLMPETVQLPSQIFPMIYTFITYYLVRQFQQKKITAHMSSGGEFYNGWRVAGVAALSLLILIVAIFAVVFLATYLSDQPV